MFHWRTMKIFITGGTGFVGSQLTKALTGRGHQLTILSRSAKYPRSDNSEIVIGDPTKPGPWQDIMKKNDAVINLAGYPVFCRWNEKNRRMIMDSRLLTTRNIVKALGNKDSKVKILLNGSAIGYYGDKGELDINEETPPGSDFLARVARIAIVVFAAAFSLREIGVADDIINLAFGITLGAIGVALALALGLGFGLGSKEIAGREVDRFLSSMRAQDAPAESNEVRS